MRSFRFLLAASVVALCGCEKQAPAPPQSSDSAASTPEVVEPPLFEQAERFGLAARLPVDTPLYLGSVSLGKHLEALKQSRYWKESMAYLDDKAPADSASLPTSISDWSKAPLDEFSMALGKDSGTAVRSLLDLQALYSELTYYGMMAGSSASLVSGSPKAGDLVGDMVSMPGLVERLIGWAKTFQFPTLILGAELENAEDTLESLKRLLESSEELRQARTSKLTTPKGETLEIREWKLETWLTPEWVSQLIENLPEDNQAAVADGIEQLRKILAEKTICLASGLVAGHAVLILAPERGSIEFVSDPAESLLARSDLQVIAEPLIEKNLAALSVWDGELLEQAVDSQPTKPMLEGALKGLRSNEMFAPMVDAIMPEVSAFSAAEAGYNEREYDHGAAVFWWDGGLHGQTIGGASTKDWILTQPLRFESLLDTPGLVFGFDGHSGTSGKGRPYFESAMALVYAAAQQALKAGLAGESFGQIGVIVDKEVIPQIKEAYDASKTLYSKALNSESAFIVDLGGQMPMVWGMSEAPKGKPMLRLAAVHDVRNRALLSQSWLRAETALGSALTKIPSPIPLSMSSPIQSERYGVMSYHQAPLFDSPDLLPCASVNDTLYILGTSKSLNEELAFQLKENEGRLGEPGLHLRIQFKNLRKLIEVASSFASDEAAATAGASTKLWAAPFGLLDARFTEQDNRVRGEIGWAIRDLMDYD